MRRVETSETDEEGREPHIVGASDRHPKPQRARRETLRLEKEYEVEDEAVEHWRIDKKIPVSLIFALVIQTVGLVAFVSQLDSRVNQLEKDSVAKEWQAERIIRIDERLTSLQNSMTELKGLVRPPAQNQQPQ